MVILPQ